MGHHMGVWSSLVDVFTGDHKTLKVCHVGEHKGDMWPFCELSENKMVVQGRCLGFG